MRNNLSDLPAGSWIFAVFCVSALTGCTPDFVVKTHPVVYFSASNGRTGKQIHEHTALMIQGSRKAGRIALDGKPRLTPFRCSTEPMAIDMSGHKPSVERRIRNLAYAKGSRRVFLLDKDGDLIARGRMCIFPTFETEDQEILRGYDVSIPVAQILKRPKGRGGLVFQSYRPLGNTDSSLKHIAWVLSLDVE